MVNSSNRSLKIPHIAITIDDCDLELGALKILEVIRPNWRKENIKLKVLTDGLCNKLLRCSLKGLEEHNNSILVRVYGYKTDLFIDRKAETQNIVLLNKYDLAPQLYATFENGLAYEFLPGCTLTVETVARENFYELVAKRVAGYHQVKLASGTKPILWEKLENYCNLLPEQFSDDYKQEKFKLLKLTKQDILNEIAFLRETLSKLNSKIVFAHNDLLLANLIFSKDDNTIKFIDYEYAGPNYQAYDIGNHFAEFAGVDNVDYSYYPSKEVQYKWLRIYLSTYHGHDNISEKEIYKLYVEVNQFALASHVFWGLWGLIQAEHSSIDFDYMSYGLIRFNEYFSKKDTFLSLQLPT